MRQYVGTVLFAVLGVTATMIGWFISSIHGAFYWWLIGGAIGVGCLIAAYLVRPGRESSRPLPQAPDDSAFIRGDVEDSTLGRVFTNADYVIKGNARRTFFGEIIHKPREHR